MEYPKMLYRAPGVEDVHGHKLALVIVDGPEAEEAARADGWHVTSKEAADAHAAQIAEKLTSGGVGTMTDERRPPGDDAPPTRAELEQKATELGIKFDGRTKDAKLAAQIAEKLKD